MKPRPALILLLGILIPGYSVPDVAEASDPKLLSVRMAPAEVELGGTGVAQQFLVLGKYSDRMERDVTSLSEWTVSDPDVLTVSTAGRAEALTEGTTLLTARLGSQSAGARVRVKDSDRQRSISFGWNIENILIRRAATTVIAMEV